MADSQSQKFVAAMKRLSVLKRRDAETPEKKNMLG